MKREFGFTQARFRYQSVMPMRSIRNPARPKPREVTHANPQFPCVRGKPPSDSPACGGKKGGCHAEQSEASEIPPNQNTAKSPNLLPQRPRSASVRRAFRFFASLRMTRIRQGASAPAALQSGAQGRFADRLCCAAAAWQLMHSTLGNPPSTYGLRRRKGWATACRRPPSVLPPSMNAPASRVR
jgi:hypothetical protein